MPHRVVHIFSTPDEVLINCFTYLSAYSLSNKQIIYIFLICFMALSLLCIILQCHVFVISLVYRAKIANVKTEKVLMCDTWRYDDRILYGGDV